MAVLSTSANIATPGLPVGSIQAFAGANAPTGWLLCDGRAVRRGDYPDLYNTLGIQYGSGDGSTTFNIPDLRGRVPAGKDDMGGTAASRLTSAVSGISGTALGSSGGSQNIPDHSHQSYIRLFEYYNDAILGNSGQAGGGGYNSRTGAWTTWQHPTTTIAGVTVNDYTGRSTPASTWVSQTNMISDGPSYQQTPQNVQPTLVVNYIIKAVADIARGGWYTQSSPPVVTQLPANPSIGEECYYYNTNTGGYQHCRWTGSAWTIFNDSGAMSVDTTGRVRMAYQPYFHMRTPAQYTGTQSPVVLTTTVYNVGNHYSTSTGRFTAPIAGNYFFTYNYFTPINLSGVMGLQINGSWYALSGREGTEGYYAPNNVTGYFYLNVGDYVTVNLYTGQWHMNNTLNSFTGGLLS